VIAIAGGGPGKLALKGDGTVQGWGWPDYLTNGLARLSNIVAISAGYEHWLTLRSDGTAKASGNPSNIVGIAASRTSDHQVDLAARDDGALIASGFAFCSGPPPPLSNVVQVSAGGGHSVALVGGASHLSLPNRWDARCPWPAAPLSGWKQRALFRSAIQWKHNGTEIPGATRSILNLSNLQPEQVANSPWK